MPTFTIDWKFFATLLAAVAGVVVPILLWQLDLSSRSLSMRLVTSIALQPETGPSVQDLQVVLDGVKLESPYLSTLELTNDGSKPISTSDFEVPFEVRLSQNQRVVRARISSTQPSAIPGSLVIDKQAVKLQPLLLNPKDSLTFAIITSGGSPTFEPHARISGISKVLYEDATTKKSGRKTAAVLLPVATLSFVLYMFYAAALIRPGGATVSRLLAAGTMLVCAVAGNQLARRAYQLLEIEETFLNFSAFLLVALLLGTPVFFRQVRRSRRQRNAV